MNILQFVSIKLTFFLLTGIVIGYYWDPFPGIALILMAILLCFQVFLLYRNARRPHLSFGIVAALSSCVLGILLVSLNSSFEFREQLSVEALERPHLWHLQIREPLKSSQYYNRFIATVLSVDSISSGGEVLCKIPVEQAKRSMAVDDQMWIYGAVKEIPKPLNPYQFNYRRYMATMGIHFEIKAESGAMMVKTAASRSILGWADAIRNELIDDMRQMDFGTDERTIIQALILGYRDEISKTVYDNYKKSGALHILAVSGLHIGIVLLIIQWLLKPLDLISARKGIKMVLILLFLWCYALLTGFSPSVIRAVTMFSFLAYANYLNRPGTAFNILALAMSFTLIFIDPLMLFQPGFQLSYAAVFSIIWLYPKLMKVWQPRRTFIRKFWQLFAVSITAQLGILPISFYYFHQFPGLFLLTNILIVPFLGIILCFGFLLTGLSALGISADDLVHTYNFIILTMNKIIASVSSMQSFQVENIYFDSGHLILLYALIISIVWMLHKAVFRRIYYCLILVIVLQLWGTGRLLQHRFKRQLSFFHSVGNSVALYQNGGKLTVYSRDSLEYKRMITDYITAERISRIKYDSLRSTYRVDKDRILVLDNRMAPVVMKQKADILLLSGSPKLNLDRYLQNNCPKMVVIDGSNYKSYVTRWSRSCEKLGIPFHDTATDGAFILDLQ